MSHHQYRHKYDYSIYGWIFLIIAIVLVMGIGVYYFSTKLSTPSDKDQIYSSANSNNNVNIIINENENINQAVEVNENINDSVVENENVNITPDLVRSNILVRYPKEGETVGLPLKIQGEGREFESVVNYRVKTSKEVVLQEGAMMTNALDVGQFGQYFASLPLNITKPTSVIVEVFAKSPKDGAEIDKIIRNINIDPGLRSLEVYFSNTDSSPKAECERVIPAIRNIVKVEKVGTAALNEMLKGPNADEVSLGYKTNIPSDTKLQTFTIEGTEGRPDFTAELNKNVSGSCLVNAIKQQISKTVLQFSTINSVRISIEGQTEGILEP